MVPYNHKMKLLVSHESPIELFEESLNYNDYQYCLVHLMEESDEYERWFRTVATRFNQEVLLDNSIFELGEAFDSKKYAYWVRELNPNYYHLDYDTKVSKDFVIYT